MSRYLGLIVFFLCSSVMAADPAKLTVDNYNKVVIGANLQFVNSCLGRETLADNDFGDGDKTLIWKAGNKKISVSFQKNKVSSKWQSGLLD
jgi:hypothetical protein